MKFLGSLEVYFLTPLIFLKLGCTSTRGNHFPIPLSSLNFQCKIQLHSIKVLGKLLLYSEDELCR